MTFENQTLSKAKAPEPPATRGGLIFLNNTNNNKDTHQETSDTESLPRQYYNQTRKSQANNKKPTLSNQPQSITQSSRGLTNVTRTLYDPNAPPPKTPPISLIQPTTTVKTIPNPSPPQAALTQIQSSISSPNIHAPVQEFYQK